MKAWIWDFSRSKMNFKGQRDEKNLIYVILISVRWTELTRREGK